jgi:thymidylate synthase (FAD)
MYCNYCKNRFGNELTFIIPCWTDLSEGHYITINGSLEGPNEHSKSLAVETFLYGCRDAEIYYNRLIDNGWMPQQARSILPNSLKTEVIMTGFISQWEEFFKLRTATSAHPQMRELAIPLKEEFIRRELIVK